MRFLQVIASVNPKNGGPIEGVVRTAQVWQAAGHTVDLASLDRPDAPWVARCPFPVIPLGPRGTWVEALRARLPLLRYGYSPHFAPWLRDHARDYDAVIVNGLWNYAALGSWRALRGGGTPYAVYTHGMLDPWFKEEYPLKHLAKQVFWLFAEGRLLAGADAVLFTTEDERVLARNAFWPYRVKERVVGYGTADVTGDPDAQVAAFRAAVPVGGRRFLLYLSRIHPKKGCDLLIRAFAELAVREPDLDLVIAGPDQVGWGKQLQALAGSLGIATASSGPGCSRATSNGAPSAPARLSCCLRTRRISESWWPKRWPRPCRSSSPTESTSGARSRPRRRVSSAPTRWTASAPCYRNSPRCRRRTQVDGRGGPALFLNELRDW
jgi:glycosyltransferase involved in cell wall biosynthesis